MRSLLLFAATLSTVALAASPSSALSVLPGDILVLGESSEVGEGIVHIDPVSGAQTLVTAGAFQDFAVTSGGDVYALEGNSVVRVDVQSGARTAISTGGLIDQPSAIAASGSDLFVAIPGSQRIVRIDSTSGAQSILTEQGFLGSLSGGTSSLNDLSLAPGGDLLVLDSIYSFGAEVIAVDLLFGAQTQLASSEDFDGSGLGVSAAGTIFVTDYSLSQSLYRMYPTTQRLLSANFPDVDGTEAIGYPSNVAVDGSGRLLMTRQVTAASMGSVFPDLVRFDPALLSADPNDDPAVEYLAIGTFSEVEVVPAVPEPGTALLLAAGLAVTGWWSRRRA